jgi:hypothetical protein
MKSGPWILGLFFLLAACGYQEGVVSRAEQSYLKFTGNLGNASVQIDGMPPFLLTSKDAAGSLPSSTNTLYQLSPGKHRVMVTREGILLVDRVLILDNHATMEVHIP